MIRIWKSGISALLFVGFAIASAIGQTSNTVSPTTVPSRVTAAVNDQVLTVLKGNTHPQAQSANDKGVVDSQLPMQRMQLVLSRSAAQQTALDKLLAEQYDPSSPNFHHWLHADAFGKLYGPSDSDIAAVTSWLQRHGFSIDSVSAGRVTIEFSGTAGQVQQAFHTEIHHYLVNGQMHLANDRDPQIPQALAPVVVGISSLHDFHPKDQSRLGRAVIKDRTTGKVTPVHSPSASSVHPQYSVSDPQAGNAQTQDIGPYDFAAIYNLTPLWNAGITGKNVSIAIAAESNIKLADVTTFRTFFGLSNFAGTTSVLLNGADPGFVNDDQVENTLDAEWAGASAPDAKVIVVVTKSTSTTGGAQLSASYIVNNEVAPVMSISYGECEAYLGSAGNAALNAIYQQGSAEGISIFNSAGDQGSAGCDNSNAYAPTAAQYGLAVNGFASSPYVTAVGGTDFLWQTQPSTYWNANNGNNSSAIGYIPELPWNGTCSSLYLQKYLFTGEASSEQLCKDALMGGYSDLVYISGGSGGASSCIGGTGTIASCTGAYPKPSWQVATGVPADNVRDIPDVSLFASSGMPDGIVDSAYLMCVSSESADLKCDYSGNNLIAQEVGGTSVSSPAMAGIMALVVQKTGANQGLANPTLYKLAATQNTATCNSSTVSGTNSCIFYDVTAGTNAMPCIAGKPNCVVNTTGDQVGILNGYSAGAGYDQATGLGSVNAYNLVNAWPATTTPVTPTVSVSPTSFTFPSTVVNTTSATTGPITITNTGTTALSFTSLALSGSNTSSFADSTTCAIGGTLAAGISCTVTLTFHPTAAGTLSATLTIVDGAGTQTVSVSGVSTAATTILTVSPATLTFASTNVGSSASAQVITLQNTGTGSVTLGTPTLAGANATSFAITATTCGSTMAPGASCTASVNFTPTTAGALTASLNLANNATGSPQSVTLSGTGVAVIAPTTTTLAASPTSTGAGMNVTLTATVKTTGATPGGTVTFYNGTNSLGTGTLDGNGSASITTTFATAGTYSLTASYAGNALFAASTSSSVTETVVAVGVSATIAPMPLTLQSGTTGSFTITITPTGGYTGTVGLSCGTLPQNISCSFAPTSLTIAAGSGAVTDTLTINTKAAATAMNPASASGDGNILAAINLWLPSSFLALAGLARRKHLTPTSKRLWMLLAILCLGLTSLGALSGCSSSSSSGPANTVLTGTYTISVTLTPSALPTQTINATLIIQ